MGLGCAYIDGHYCSMEEARISVLDPGFTHSDVVYDVTSTWCGLFFRLNDHIERFLQSCAGFRIKCPQSSGVLKTLLAECVERGEVSDSSYCALVLTRGRYSKEGERSRDIFSTTPALIAYAVPYVSVADEEQQERGLSAIVSKTLRIPSACVDTRFKNYHWGDLTQGKFEANAAGADIALHLSIEGGLTEGAGFNVFFARSGCLYTPEHNILLGITRQTVMDMSADLRINCEVGTYDAEALRRADECFITSTAGGIMPVTMLDGRSLGGGKPGSITLRLRDEYWRRREEGWLGTPVSDLVNPR